jgi:RNA polymerase sigma-70 factor (family 1)
MDCFSGFSYKFTVGKTICPQDPEQPLLSAPDTYQEQELLLAISEGSEAAFAFVHQHYYNQLRPFLWRFTASHTDAEEILQETFIRVWLSRDKLPGITHFSAWLYKVASREALSYLRTRLSGETQLPRVAEVTDPVSDHPSPLDLTHHSRLQAVIGEAIAQMPEQRRRIFQLNRIEGLKVGEIAHRLGLSVSTVKNTVAAAQQHIRAHLAHAGYPLPLGVCTILLLL